MSSSETAYSGSPDAFRRHLLVRLIQDLQLRRSRILDGLHLTRILGTVQLLGTVGGLHPYGSCSRGLQPLGSCSLGGLQLLGSCSLGNCSLGDLQLPGSCSLDGLPSLNLGGLRLLGSLSLGGLQLLGQEGDDASEKHVTVLILLPCCPRNVRDKGHLDQRPKCNHRYHS